MNKRKIASIIICFLLMTHFSISAFAESSDLKSYYGEKISLALSDDIRDQSIMANSSLDKISEINDEKQELKKGNYFKNVFEGKSKLDITFLTKEEVDEGIKVTGDLTLNVGSQINTFQFKECLLEEEQEGLFRGALRSEINVKNVEVPIVVDFATTQDFKMAVASLSVGTIEEGIGILFFGEIFDEYTKYVERYIKESSTKITPNIDIGKASTSDSTPYEYCFTKTVSNVDSFSGSKETAIACVAKRDFRQSDSAYGFEAIRIFSRTYNVRNIVDEIAIITPYSTTAVFECPTANFLEVVDTYPDRSSSSFPGNIEFYTSLTNPSAIGYGVIQLIADMLKSVTSTIDKTSSDVDMDNRATVTIRINQNKWSAADLPSSIGVSSAVENTTNGTIVKVRYRIGDTARTYASVDAKGKVTYQCAYQSGRTALLDTGYAKGTHIVNVKN